MNRVPTLRWRFLWLLCFFCLPALVWGAVLPRVAIYYGNNPPYAWLNGFDGVIVHPDKKIDLSRFHNDVYVHINIGEIPLARVKKEKLPKQWFLGENQGRQTAVVDASHPGWQHYYLQHIVKPLVKQGYRNFYIDNLRAYRQFSRDRRSRRILRLSFVKMISTMKKRYPKSKIILHRGFALVPRLKGRIVAVAAGSLFYGRTSGGGYYRVGHQQRATLLAELNKIKNKYKVPVIVIDYMSMNKRQKAQANAAQIARLGFIPWVGNASMTTIGVGRLTPYVRKILIFYDGKANKDVRESPAFKYLATPLEYMGYVPRFVDIRQPLPRHSLLGRYRGIIFWLTPKALKSSSRVLGWLRQQIRREIPVVFFGDFEFALTSNWQRTLGLKRYVYRGLSQDLTISKSSPIIGFETKPTPRHDYFLPLKINRGNVLLQIKTPKNKTSDVVAITPWGGYALQPYVVATLPNHQTRWVINPFVFLKRALRLSDIPAPDTTTQNGRRLMMVHVAGQGFVNRSEWLKNTIAGDTIFKKILRRFEIPTTVSVVTSELSEDGLYPRHARRLQKIAKRIFRLPWVEAASNSYSYPYDWLSKARKDNHIPVPNYRLNWQQEINGSVEFINDYLLPHGKHCKVFLWTGYANPSLAALALTYAEDLANFNGGHTRISNDDRSLTAVSPLGIAQGKYFQVFAPFQNDNILTNYWKGPLSGYKRVVEAFQLTDTPRRLKPIDIYYHFYSGSKQSALNALTTVYEWALKQTVFNVYVSDFFKVVLDFQTATLARDNDHWYFFNKGDLQELRVPMSLGYPDLKRSENIAGFNVHAGERYIHLGTAKRSILVFSHQKPSQPYLVSANGFVTHFFRDAGGMQFSLNAYLPLEFVLFRPKNCTVKVNEYNITGQDMGDDKFNYRLAKLKTADVSIACETDKPKKTKPAQHKTQSPAAERGIYRRLFSQYSNHLDYPQN
jgi:polysaccharide biosynthesis protein PelA